MVTGVVLVLLLLEFSLIVVKVQGVHLCRLEPYS